MKSNRFWIILFSFVALVCAAVLLAIGSGSSSGGTAYIYWHGELEGIIELDAISESRTITLKGGNGINIIEAERGRIRVAEADCSNSLCVRQGWVSGGLTPIVCLPNGLVIRIEGGSGVDGVVG